MFSARAIVLCGRDRCCGAPTNSPLGDNRPTLHVQSDMDPSAVPVASRLSVATKFKTRSTSDSSWLELCPFVMMIGGVARDMKHMNTLRKPTSEFKIERNLCTHDFALTLPLSTKVTKSVFLAMLLVITWTKQENQLLNSSHTDHT